MAKYREKKYLRVLLVYRLAGMVGKRPLKMKCRSRDVVLFKLAGPLDGLNPQESQSQHQGKSQVDHLGLPFTDLRGADCENYGQTAADQHRGVDRPQRDIERTACSGEFRVIPEAVDEIGAEHPAEEHDLGRQKQPHAQR